jgi:hypothetical protein
MSSPFDNQTLEKEIPASDFNRSGEVSNAARASKPESKRKDTKLIRILRLFFYGDWWDFQSIRAHGDSCLHSSVSAYRNIFGIEFEDEWQTKNGFDGNPTRCKRWKLKRSPENLRRVRAFLGIVDDPTDQ